MDLDQIQEFQDALTTVLAHGHGKVILEVFVQNHNLSIVAITKQTTFKVDDISKLGYPKSND